MNYFNLHSHFSLMGGLNSPEELCIATLESGANAIALTDTNGLYGVPEFLEVARNIGIKAVIGTEIRRDDFNFIILVKNQVGYKDLCRYLTKFHMEELNLEQSIDELSQSRDLIFVSFHKKFILGMHEAGVRDLFFELTSGFFVHRDYLWAKSHGISSIANNKVHYLDKENHECYELIRAIDQNSTLDEIDTSGYHNKNCYLQDQDKLEREFSLYPIAIKNAKKILDNLSSEWFSSEPISPGYNGLSEKDCDEKLKKKCIKKIPTRYDLADKGLIKRVYERIDYEMNIISHKKFSSYFLNVEDMANQCDYTCGRGSSAASIINYLLDITHVDPISENLLFDRFMNVDRKDPPDIDVDFPSDQRDDVLDYIFEKFKGRAAMVANHNYLRGRSAMREVAKVFGVKDDEISYTLDRLHRVELNSTWKKIHYFSSRIEGVVRHLSVHCGGVVITPERIDHYAPIEMSKKGYPVLQWEKDQTELSGLIKTDILGNKGLSVIRDVINAVNIREDKQLCYKDLDAQNDEKAKNVFITGNTVGVVHFESPRCKTLLAAFKDASLLTLSIVCSIIRPAAMVQVTEMLRRFHGGRFSYAHPELEEILGVTKGIMIYQEDVMRVSKAMAGFTSQEGNELRKVLAKKHKNKKLKYYKEKFFKGCWNKGISQQNVDLLWADILSFAGYSFCKPHSDSYSLVAYKSAYLKAYYPAEFMAAVITNGGGFYVGNVEDYLNEARRMGVVILPPDINYSNYDYSGNNMEMRVGLKQIKHIGKKLLKKIIGERQLGQFSSVQNFLERVSPSFNEARILVKARCFGSVRIVLDKKLNHTEMMWMVYEFFAKKEGSLDQGMTLPILERKIEEYQKEKLISWEHDFLNGFVTFPSWFLYKDLLKNEQIIPGSSLKDHLGKEIILYGQKVSQKRVATKFQQHMAFITFSDDTCMFNTTFFPQAYEDCRDLLFLGGSYLIKGRVEQDMKDYQIVVSDLKRIGEI
jgi:error-prone DNA polymerase